MRLTEGLQLRVKDLDFDHRAVIVRHGKGGRDRVLMLPEALQTPLKSQLSHAHSLWAANCASGRAGVEMPRCAGAQVSAGGSVVVLGVPAGHTFDRSAHGSRAASPHV